MPLSEEIVAYLCAFTQTSSATDLSVKQFSFNRIKHSALLQTLDPVDESIWSSTQFDALAYLRAYAHCGSDVAIASAQRKCKSVLSDSFLGPTSRWHTVSENLLGILNTAKAAKEASKGPKLTKGQREQQKYLAAKQAAIELLQSYAAWEAGYSPEGVWNGSLPQWLITNALDAETLPEAEFEALVGMSQRLKSGERKSLFDEVSGHECDEDAMEYVEKPCCQRARVLLASLQDEEAIATLSAWHGISRARVAQLRMGIQHSGGVFGVLLLRRLDNGDRRGLNGPGSQGGSTSSSAQAAPSATRSAVTTAE